MGQFVTLSTQRFACSAFIIRVGTDLANKNSRNLIKHFSDETVENKSKWITW
jgi:hypothetical protein